MAHSLLRVSIRKEFSSEITYKIFKTHQFFIFYPSVSEVFKWSLLIVR